MDRYAEGDTPWDIGRADGNLVRMAERGAILPCAVLEAGCGTGADAVWLAEQGFTVSGLDESAAAIRLARERAGRAGVTARFFVWDFLGDPPPVPPQDLVYDRGLFHSYSGHADRRAVARKAAACLGPDGKWLLVCGRKDAPGGAPGVCRCTALEVVAAAEPYFDTLLLEAAFFSTKDGGDSPAWLYLGKKRAS
jgi:SAM-dependent methyltransferase